MIFSPLAIEGAFSIRLGAIEDERGRFVRTFCAEEFASHGLNPAVVQCNLSFNRSRGTLRGLHYQVDPYGECKLIRCTRGAIHDVLVDIRPFSPTFKKWVALELRAADDEMVYAPAGLAHGFLTLEDQSEVHYQMSSPYVPRSGRGIRWNDRAFGIDWPEPVRVISERDATYPDFAS